MEATLVTAVDHPVAFKVEDAGDSVAILTFDTGTEGTPFVLSSVTIDALERTLDGLAARGLRGLLIRSNHASVFCAGADVEAMASLTSMQEAEDLVRRGQRVFSLLERLPFPTAALIHGTCVGGGFELALACSARTATPDPATRIGLPEVKLGILPAWGGSTRLPRLIGFTKAVPLITGGRTLNALGALRSGFVDSVVPKEHLVREGMALLDRARRGLPLRNRKPSLATRFLDGTAPGRALVSRLALKAIHRETKGHYPAPEAALRVMSRGLSLPIEKAFELERREVVTLLETSAHRNLLRLFRMSRESKRPAIYKSGRDARCPKEVVVIGAGVMGAGIAALFAKSGLAVRVVDAAPAALAKARRLAEGELARMVQRKDLSRAEATTRLLRMSFSTELTGLRGADLVIEAVPEKRELKDLVLRTVADAVRPGTLIATNTSSFPIAELGTAVKDRARFLGLHFFNPPLKMPLLEIVRGPETSDEAVAIGLRLASEIGKTPIVVGDAPGFLVNRLLAPYFMEACRALQEGAGLEVIDEVIVAYGLPMGPFRLMDEVGLDVIHDACGHMAGRDGSGFLASPLIEALVAKKKLGRKSGEGFYRYRKNGKSAGMSRTFFKIARDFVRPGSAAGHAPDELRQRLLGRMAAEARTVLGEGIVLSPEDIDLGTVFGIGYPAFRGGLLFDLGAKGSRS